ncbi:MAG: hypothetical protein AUJ51_10700 [Elusimicrobia bacterium CG1_02_56_21]|nr:MAG: hypothetical protein AUJ51_10700 [Elusimicrobia bacterium CG1_02_56_21]
MIKNTDYLSRIFSGLTGLRAGMKAHVPAISFSPQFRRQAGVTLTELMIAVSVLTIGVIGSMGSFKYINQSITQSRIKTISTNLAQEKMEVLRNKPYFQLLVTTSTAVTTDYSPNFTYDNENYPPQVITLWGMPALTRIVKVDYVALSGSVATALPYTSNDTGMKKITVSVLWTIRGTAQKVTLESYYENPTAAVLSSGLTGTVTDASSGIPVGNALIQVQGSPKWRGYSDPVTGVYSFQVAPGTYTLVCSTQGYFPASSSELQVAAGAYATKNFSIGKIAAGSISGMAYIRDHMVIYMVVASTQMVNGDNIEFVSLYNPTTSQINMLTNPADSNSNNIKLSYYGEAGEGKDISEFWLNHSSTYVPAGHYYLIASSGTFTFKGYTVTADAIFTNANKPPCSDLGGGLLNCIWRDKAGAIRLSDVGGNIIDTLGWTNNGAAKPAPYYETTARSMPNGIEEGRQFFRYTGPGYGSEASGNCYDNNVNSSNFFSFNPAIFRAMNIAAGYKAPVTGTPGAGAIVTSNDGLSSPATASSTGYFLLTQVATGTVANIASTWEVMITSYAVSSSSAGLSIIANQNKDLGVIVLSSAISGGIASGYVYGSGPDQTVPKSGFSVGSAGTVVNTNSQGFYRLFLATGTAVITANYGLANGSYQSSDETVTITAGAVTNVPDFHLAQSGTITGYVTSGTGALPNIVVHATNGGPVYEDTSDSTGHYYLTAATSSVVYTITPVLDPLQSYTSLPTSPLTASMAVPGASVFSGTITVIGAMATITGTVVASSVSITTGVLVVASTATISDPLATITAASSLTLPVFYSVSSQADGTYSLDVRSSTSTLYNMRAFYPVVNANTGAVTYTSRSFSSVSVSTAGTTVTRNFA